VTAVGTGASRAGNWVTVRGDDGWRWLYLHLNDDTPGTDDGAAPPELTFGPGIRVGARVAPGQVLGYVGDSGNAEEEAPQLHFEVRTPANAAVDPWTSLRVASGRDPATTCTPATDPARRPDPAASRGVWLATADGGVFALGGAGFGGSAGDLDLRAPIVGMAAAPVGGGYWLVAADGGVFAFGGAPFLGSMGGVALNRPVVGMVPTATGRGYWLVASDGGVFAFGDASFVGSLGSLALNRPIVGMAPLAGSVAGGYWLVASDGGVFAFGSAAFVGSWLDAGAPVRGIAAPLGASGYLLVTSDGAVAVRGDARAVGSLQTSGRCDWPSVAGVASTRTGRGAWIAGRDGSVVALGDAPDVEDLAELGVDAEQVVAVVAVP
jgi:hypothetical protein